MAKDIDRRLQKFETALVNFLTKVDDKLDSKLRKKLHKRRTKLKQDPDYSKKTYRRAVLRAHEQEDKPLEEVKLRLNQRMREFATERRAEIEATVKRMEADAATAEETLQKLNQTAYSHGPH